METGALQAVVKFAGVGGVVSLVLLFVYRAIIGKDIFPKLSSKQGYNILLWMITFTFLTALAGMGAYVSITKPSAEVTRLIYRGSVSAAADKQPVKGAEATILGRGDIAPQFTNEQGFFTFELPATAGKFNGTVRVRHPDYEVAEKAIELQADTTGEPLLLVPRPLPEREWIGTVYEADGSVVVGVTVKIEGTSAVTRTGVDGRFGVKVRTQQPDKFVLLVERDGKVLSREFHAPGQDISIFLSKAK